MNANQRCASTFPFVKYIKVVDGSFISAAVPSICTHNLNDLTKDM
jgi:hypothetical protein